jgi:hypothetical protein
MGCQRLPFLTVNINNVGRTLTIAAHSVSVTHNKSPTVDGQNDQHIAHLAMTAHEEMLRKHDVHGRRIREPFLQPGEEKNYMSYWSICDSHFQGSIT